jgi:hypothetical protein
MDDDHTRSGVGAVARAFGWALLAGSPGLGFTVAHDGGDDQVGLSNAAPKACVST